MQHPDELTLGDVTVTRIEESHGPTMPTDQFFPDLPEQAWQDHRETLVPDHLGADDAMVHVAMQTWLLRSEGRTILIDTAVGNDKSRPAVPGWVGTISSWTTSATSPAPGSRPRTPTWWSTPTCTPTTSAGTPA